VLRLFHAFVTHLTKHFLHLQFHASFDRRCNMKISPQDKCGPFSSYRSFYLFSDCSLDTPTIDLYESTAKTLLG
jgi:hypothetical protein